MKFVHVKYLEESSAKKSHIATSKLSLIPLDATKRLNEYHQI